MSLQVQKISADSIQKKNQKKSIQENKNSNSTAISMTGKSSVKKVVVDKSNDGKFNFSQALKNFGKGLISPITAMFSSKKNFLIGAGMMAGGALLIAATGGAAAPLLVAAGVAMGAVQAGKAAHKIIKAKNGDDVEKAFYDIGGATGTIGLSVIGAKASLKQAGVATEGLGAFRAVGKTFTTSKSSVVNSYKTFKSGYYKTNLTRAFKFAKTSPKLRTFSKQISKEGKASVESAYKEVQGILSDEFKPMLGKRPKGQVSVLDKLVYRSQIKSKISKIKNDADLPPAQKTKLIQELKNKKKLIKTDIESAKNQIGDLIGTRLILEDSSPMKINKLVADIVKGINENKLVITELENYRGPNGKFYFSKANVNAIKTAAEAKGMKIKVAEGEALIKDSGYTCVQMNIKHKCGASGEFQIRGKHVNQVAEWEHYAYDLRQGKDLSKGNREIGEVLAPVKKALQKLKKEEYLEYEKYLAKNYVRAQKTEAGLRTYKVRLPEKFDRVLSAENLDLVHTKIAKLPSYDCKNPWSILPQVPALKLLDEY